MALEFNGIDNFVEITLDSSLDVSASFTIGAWIKTNGDTAIGSVIRHNTDGSKVDQTALMIDWTSLDASNADKATIGHKDSDSKTWKYITGTTNVNDGEWHHIFATFDGSILKVYVDKILEGTSPSFTSTDYGASSWLIGKFRGNAEYFNGLINDARIYNRAISPDEIAILYYSQGTDNITNGLIARWLMNEGSDGVTTPVLIEPSWDIQYEGNVEPDDDGWTLGGTDYASCAGGILTIETTADAQNCYYYKTPDIDFDTGFTLKFRAKVISTGGVADNLRFNIRDGTQNERVDIALYTFKITATKSTGWSDICTFNTTAAYHTYILTVKGTTAKLYIDNVLKGSWSVNTIVTDDLIQFGESDSAMHGKIEIDYIYYALEYTKEAQILDISGNGNHGTPVNSPIYRGAPIKLVKPIFST